MAGEDGLVKITFMGKTFDVGDMDLSDAERGVANFICEEIDKEFERSAKDMGSLPPDESSAIAAGYIRGALQAASLLATQSQLPYLAFLNLAGCLGAAPRVLSAGEDSLHEMLHRLQEDFPDGDLGDVVIGSDLLEDEDEVSGVTMFDNDDSDKKFGAN